jgi:hypothetical protein
MPRKCTRQTPTSGILWRVETILSVLEVAIAVIVVFLILMHSGKDSGLSGAFGVGSGTGPRSCCSHVPGPERRPSRLPASIVCGAL